MTPLAMVFLPGHRRLIAEDVGTPVGSSWLHAIAAKCGVDFVPPSPWCIAPAVGWPFKSCCSPWLVACLGWKLTHNIALKVLFSPFACLGTLVVPTVALHFWKLQSLSRTHRPVTLFLADRSALVLSSPSSMTAPGSVPCLYSHSECLLPAAAARSLRCGLLETSCRTTATCSPHL